MAQTLSVSELDAAGIRVVRLQYPDLHGICRGKDIPIGAFEHAADEGIGFVEAIMTVDLRHNVTAGFEQGFPDIAEGTVYALLVRFEQKGFVDVEKVPSEKGPPRKVYSLNAQGQEYLEEFWRTWIFLAEQLEQLHQGGR